MPRNPFWMAGYSQALGQLSEAFRDVLAGQDEQPGQSPDMPEELHRHP
ncbi:hypothetical protein [uncultured Kushneria sp.]|nr:hypothetical protein [uncultured Kushneria sp.]